MQKITTCRVNEQTKKKIQFSKSVINIHEEIKNNNNKHTNYSEDEIINMGLDELLKSMGVEMKEDLSETYIRGMTAVLKSRRIDNNFKPDNKRILKSLGEAMFDEGIVKKRLGYDEVLTELIYSYLEISPKFKKYTLREQYINQEFKRQDMLKKERKYYDN